MKLLHSFRLSLYLMLGVATAALGSASDFFLPEIPYITVFCLLLLAAAYWFEDRYELSLNSANVVGGVLSAILIFWIGFQFIRPGINLLDTLPFPASLLPYLGPALMLLIPSKMFRPKHVGDYWAMYGLGLISVALACTMASDTNFALFLFLWCVLFVWSLSLFFLYREVWLPGQGKAVRLQKDSRWILLPNALRWTFAFGAVAFLLFLATPRMQDNRWALTIATSGRMETGLSADSSIDLNRTGTLKANGEKAFDVTATEADGSLKNDLDPTQRWRSIALVNYADGKWTRGGLQLGSSIVVAERAYQPRYDEERPRPRSDAFPRLNEKQFYLMFSPSSRNAPGTPLAAPVQWKAREPAPISSMIDDGYVPWMPSLDGNFSMPAHVRRYRYMQAVPPVTQPDLGPPMLLQAPGIGEPADPDLLLRLPSGLGDLREWVIARAADLVFQGKVPGVKRLRMDPLRPERIAKSQHEAVAKALEQYLATSGEFTYSTELQRSDRKLDPAVDFLFNLKSGHCERFATALVLMLRNVGIPAQLILGFRGCELLEDGKYEVRQDHAHSWVEILIRRPEGFPDGVADAGTEPAKEYPRHQYHWMTLDPTPGGERDALTSNGGDWFDRMGKRFETFYRDYILGYNTDLREGVGRFIANKAASTRKSVVEGGWVHLVVGGFALLAATFFLRSRGKARRLHEELEAERAAPALGFHRRLFELLAKRGMVPEPGQTPREFAARVGAELRPELAELADVPGEAAELFYRARFGGEAVPADQLSRFDARFTAFEAAFLAKA